MGSHDLAVFGVFQPETDLQTIINQLFSSGFSESSLNLICSQSQRTFDIDSLQKSMILIFAKIGSGIGAVFFLLMGASFLFFGSIQSGIPPNMLLFERILFFLFITILGALFGGASGALIGIGTPQSAIFRFANYLEAGATLISVRVKNSHQENIAKQTLELLGARDVIKLKELRTWTRLQNTRQRARNQAFQFDQSP